MDNNEKAKWLADFYGDLAKNENGYSYKGNNKQEELYGPSLNTPEESIQYYSVNPSKNIINLHYYIDKDIDMELDDGEDFQDETLIISDLVSIDEYVANEPYRYTTDQGDRYSLCRVRMDKWMHHDKKIIPVTEGLVFDVEFSDGVILKFQTKPNDFDWFKTTGKTITAFRIIGQLKNWKYEWEK